MSLPSLRLKSNADRRLRSGHLWLYSNEIDTKLSPLSDFKAGDQVIVETASGKPMGVAVMSPHTLVCARIVSRETEHRLDKSLLVHRLNIALSLRERRAAVYCAFLPFSAWRGRFTTGFGSGSFWRHCRSANHRGLHGAAQRHYP